MPLSVRTPEDRKFLGMIAGFWTGRQYPLDPDEVDVGLSNVYSSSVSDQALVAVSFRFRSDHSAERVEGELVGTHSGDDRPPWIRRSGRTVSIVKGDPRLPSECAATLTKHIEADGVVP